MPDPLSITVAVISIVKGSIQALEKYNELRAKFNSTDVSVLSAKTQCDCVLIALNKIQETLLARPRLAARWTSSEVVSGRNLQSTMGACETTFAIITERLHRVINDSTDDHGTATTKAKMEYMWKASEINEILVHVSGLTTALTLLLTALNTESQAEMMDLLTSEGTRSIFSKVSSQAKTIKAAHDRLSERSISQLSPTSTEDQDFEFDAFVINTEIYRKAWATARKRKPRVHFNLPDVVKREQRYLAKAMASFDPGSGHPERIGFSRFETLEVSTISGQWWHAKKDTGEEGLVPSNYLTLFDAHLPLHNDISPRKVKAVYRYVRNPDKPDELSFDKGEVLEAWDKVPGWWNAKNRSGKTGVVPSPYFILDGEATRTEVSSVTLTQSPLQPVPKLVKGLNSITHNQDQHILLADDSSLGMYDFLDQLSVAEAVLAASAAPDDSSSPSAHATASGKQSLHGGNHDRQNPKGIETLALPLATSSSNFSILDSIFDPHQSATHDTPKESLRFVSQTEFQSMLLSFLKESVFDEKHSEMSQGKLESWINWVMANPGEDDLNVFEMYGLEDEIRFAVLPQLIGFEGEQWGNRNTGAVLDAWVREALSKGSIRESVQRESVRDLLILWQDSGPRRKGKKPA